MRRECVSTRAEDRSGTTVWIVHGTLMGATNETLNHCGCTAGRVLTHELKKVTTLGRVDKRLFQGIAYQQRWYVLGSK
jgi:hypothetical protein